VGAMQMRNLLNFDRVDDFDANSGEPKFYMIGELALHFGLSAKTIRFYEKEGLLSPQRHGKFRVFIPRDARVLQAILRLRKFGLSIATIREIIYLRHEDRNSEKMLELVAIILKNQLDELLKQRENLDQAIADVIKLVNV
jgi:DNA-binding transcriptional MerR regulator